MKRNRFAKNLKIQIHLQVLPSPAPCFHVIMHLRNNFASTISYHRSNIIWFVDLIVITLLYYITLQKSPHSVYFEKKKNNETIWNHHWLESGGEIFITYIFYFCYRVDEQLFWYCNAIEFTLFDFTFQPHLTKM